MRILSGIIVILFVLQSAAFAAWYGCAEYTKAQLESLSETELRAALDRNDQLSQEIYEDAAVQSIMDKRIYHFRSRQYLDCIEYNKEIERALKNRFPGSGVAD